MLSEFTVTRTPASNSFRIGCSAMDRHNLCVVVTGHADFQRNILVDQFLHQLRIMDGCHTMPDPLRSKGQSGAHAFGSAASPA